MSACPSTGTTIINDMPLEEAGWVWSPQEEQEEDGGMMEVSYDVVKDRYFTTNTAGGERGEWGRGVWRSDNIQRKEELESGWNMVYLARERDSHKEKPGLLEWRVKVREGQVITRVVVRVESTVYYGACVTWEVSGGGTTLSVSPGSELDTNQLAGATQVLSGCQGEHFSVYFSPDISTGNLTWRSGQIRLATLTAIQILEKRGETTRHKVQTVGLF